MPNNLVISTWNIHGLSNKVLGDKTKIKDFIENIMKTDLIFLTETWCNKEIDIPDFKAFVSDPSIPPSNKACRISGGITLLIKVKLRNLFQSKKDLKITYGAKFQKRFLKTKNIYTYVVHTYHQKNHIILTMKSLMNYKLT
jgi:hypothetical protein